MTVMDRRTVITGAAAAAAVGAAPAVAFPALLEPRTLEERVRDDLVDAFRRFNARRTGRETIRECSGMLTHEVRLKAGEWYGLRSGGVMAEHQQTTKPLFSYDYKRPSTDSLAWVCCRDDSASIQINTPLPDGREVSLYWKNVVQGVDTGVDELHITIHTDGWGHVMYPAVSA